MNFMPLEDTLTVSNNKMANTLNCKVEATPHYVAW